MLSLTIILGIVAVLCAYAYYTQNFSKYASYINQFPGPNTIPVIGNCLEIRAPPVVIFKRLRDLAKKFGSSYRLWMANNAVINIITAEDAEVILSSPKHIKKSVIYDFLQGWLGTGLLTSTGTKWHQRRKLLTPAFHFNILRKFTETFEEHAEQLVEELKKEINVSKTNVVPFVTSTTLHSICETAMGTYMDPTDEIQNKYVQALYDLGDLIVYRTSCPPIFNQFIFNISPFGWKHNKYVNLLHNFTTSVIKERETNFDDSVLESSNNDETGKKTRLAMLDLLISAKKNDRSIDDEGIREEVDTFMFEGHDTTSVAISFALMLLANYKEHQEKVVQELEDIFGDSTRHANYDDFQKMNYLELCIKESLRMYPSVPLIARTIEEDMELSTGTVPGGTFINIHIFDLHYDARYFPEPHKYDPERFLPENSKGRHPFAYIPFSAGPRNCIGQKYAILEMKSVISSILRNFILEPVDSPNSMDLKVDFVLRNDKEIFIKFKLRNDPDAY